MNFHVLFRISMPCLKLSSAHGGWARGHTFLITQIITSQFPKHLSSHSLTVELYYWEQNLARWRLNWELDWKMENVWVLIVWESTFVKTLTGSPMLVAGSQFSTACCWLARMHAMLIPIAPSPFCFLLLFLISLSCCFSTCLVLSCWFCFCKLAHCFLSF